MATELRQRPKFGIFQKALLWILASNTNLVLKIRAAAGQYL